MLQSCSGSSSRHKSQRPAAAAGSGTGGNRLGMLTQHSAAASTALAETSAAAAEALPMLLLRVPQ
jgi:hypothetical protein